MEDDIILLVDTTMMIMTITIMTIMVDTMITGTTIDIIKLTTIAIEHHISHITTVSSMVTDL
jgi:hypothetical protein